MTWFANVLIVVGLWLAGSKHRSAFAFTIVGESIWTVVAACRQQWDLATICAIFTILAIRNWHKWNQNNAR